MQSRGTSRSTRVRRTGAAALAAAAGLWLLSAGVAPADAQVQWRTGTGAVPRAMPKGDLAGALTQLASREDASRVVVQLNATASAADKAALAAEGVRLLAYLGGDAYFATLDADALNPAGAAALGRITSVSAIQAAWKMHPDSEAGIIHPWTVVGEPSDRSKLDAAIGDEEALKTANPTVGLYVMFHPDVDLQSEGLRIIQQHGGTVRSFLPGINTAVVDLPHSSVKPLASEDPVQYVEPPLPQFSEMNAQNRLLTGADIVNEAPYGLTGAGVKALVYDGGKVKNNPEHTAMLGRVTIGPSDTAGVSDHATHVSGTIAGDGTGSTGNMHKGMAPAAHIISYGFEQDGGLHEGFLYTDPGDLNEDYTEAQGLLADVANNSIGTNTATNGFPCDWTGNYGITDALIDAVVRGTPGSGNGQPFRVVWANGNERQTTRCGNQFFTTAPPATAKNHLTVGALNANDDSMTSFSSWGPTDDGRMKPDISAPGCESGGDGGVTSTGSSGGYNVKCGTSMASPTVCGLSALIIEDYRNLYPSEPMFRNSFLRALFAHTANDNGNTGPDNQFGYGSVRIQPAIDQLRSGHFVEDQVDHGQTYSVIVVVQPGDPVMKVTIAWDDAPGTPNVNPNLVNDLDLVVMSPSQVRAYPWTLDIGNPAAPAVQTQENHVDNIEQVLVNNPEPGGWIVEVRGTTVPSGPQPFSLVASPFLVNCSDAGTVSVNQPQVPCESSLNIRVIDCGLNQDPGQVETVDVVVSSTSNPAGIVVTLTETAAEAAAFLGSVTLSTSGSPGTLLVAHGDTVTATYEDADNGSGNPATVTANSAVDCVAPVISGVAVVDLQPRDATISFMTDEPSRPTVRWGTTCGSFTGELQSSALGTSHTVNITGLQDDTLYYFEVAAADVAGNSSTDDNGGNCYDFMTPQVPDFYTELFTGGNDTGGKAATWVPDGSVDFYGLCVDDPIADVPTDPSGHTQITFPSTQDDQFVQINLSGGAMIPFYGVSYPSFFVGSNGYVTFGAGDTDYSESLEDHFDLPRIAGLFDDLHPGQGGSVRWAQLADRVVVTWVDVPEYNAGNQNTFQIEMYYTGDVRVSWAEIAAADGLVGVSEGEGVDPDFLMSDLTTYGVCGPRPPTVGDITVGMPANQPTTITLPGFDDGIPGPLSFIVTSLPAHGSLADPGAGAINAAPYTLVGNGDMVTYTPAFNYLGADSFQFKANDGGVPPDGGDSNTGTVTLDIGVPTPVYEFLVDDTNPGWSVDPDWAFGQPTGMGTTGRLDPTSGFTGANVYGYNLNGHYPNNLSPVRYLTTGAIDCSGLTQVSIEFRRWLGVESASFDHANLEISTDGSTWTTVWEHTGSALNEQAWTLQTYDVSAIADEEPTVYFRWGMGTTDGSVTYQGWNIDDIRIIAVAPIETCPGDLDGSGTIDSTDLNFVLSGFGCTGGGCPGDADGDGDTDTTDLNIVLSGFGTSCP